MCASLLLPYAAAIADSPPVTTQIVDLANKVDGVHPGFRAFHAKGIVVEGTPRCSPGHQPNRIALQRYQRSSRPSRPDHIAVHEGQLVRAL